jgi:hypothetical protein
LLLGLWFTDDWSYDEREILSLTYFGLFGLGAVLPCVGFFLVLKNGSQLPPKIAHYDLKVKTDLTNTHDNSMQDHGKETRKATELPELRVDRKTETIHDQTYERDEVVI